MSQLSENITLEQLADHNTLESLWIAVHGHVYDLTTFSSDHPGGIEALESNAGTDGTESYNYAAHSESNMAKMQQYRIGRLAGSFDEQNSPISSITLPLESKRIRSAASRLKMSKFPKLAVTLLSVTSLVLAFSYWSRGSLNGYISPFQFTNVSYQNVGSAFWLGVASASSISIVGLNYIYKTFLSTLDYQNDVFSFPPTIPRKIKR